MSVFGDFQRVWVQRFPESALPAAWEEDVRANLAKHKQKVAILREELEKEEFYVEYLETLLTDVEKHKASSHGKPPPFEADVLDPDDKTTDSKQVTQYAYLSFQQLLIIIMLYTQFFNKTYFKLIVYLDTSLYRLSST